MVAPAVARAAAPPKRTPAPDPQWEQYVGTYTWQNSDVKIMILNGELVMIDPESDNPWTSRVTLKPVSEHVFRAIPARFHYSLNGELMRFEVDDGGRVTRVGTANFYRIRKEAQ